MKPIKIREIRLASWRMLGCEDVLDCAYNLVMERWGWVEELPDPEHHDVNLDSWAHWASDAERDVEAAELVNNYWAGYEKGLNEPKSVYQKRDEWAYSWGRIALYRQWQCAIYVRDIVAEIWMRLGGSPEVMYPRRPHEITLGSLAQAHARRLGYE